MRVEIMYPQCTHTYGHTSRTETQTDPEGRHKRESKGEPWRDQAAVINLHLLMMSADLTQCRFYSQRKQTVSRPAHHKTESACCVSPACNRKKVQPVSKDHCMHSRSQTGNMLHTHAKMCESYTAFSSSSTGKKALLKSPRLTSEHRRLHSLLIKDRQ